MLRKLNLQNLAENLALFKSNPKFVLFENAANLQIRQTLPNHPCNFYIFENSRKNLKQFYCIRHNLLPDNERSILMIESDGEWNSDDLENGVKNLVEYEENLSKIGLFIGNTKLAETFAQIIPKILPKLQPNGFWPCKLFHVDPSKFQKILDAKLSDLPENMRLGNTRVEDAQIINDTWKFATPDEVLQQREKLSRLPTSCVFHNDAPISFEMIGLHGQLSHQFTFPEYRNLGLGTIVDISLLQKAIAFGIHPYKCVEVDNEKVVKRSKNQEEVWSTVEDNVVYIGFNRH
ncbi:unnamed protein product [Caenorhabditis angaria]|uniref:Glycine N-acyltransferase-like protein n=1 Tax=Caenorhabditis angaria TaxID=860376 RepID=A0A9P1I6K1_9PELO|nr:unnamed protein product [Caenorhabditis angaria]